MITTYMMNHGTRVLVHFVAELPSNVYSAAAYASQNEAQEKLNQLCAKFIKEKLVAYTHQRSIALARTGHFDKQVAAAVNRIDNITKLHKPASVANHVQAVKDDILLIVPHPLSAHKSWIPIINSIIQLSNELIKNNNHH